MEQKYLEQLHRDLKYLGFGEGGILHEELDMQVAKGEMEFSLNTEAFFEEARMEVILYYFRGESVNNYHLKRYKASLCYSDTPEKNKEQSFYIYKGKGFTCKEAFNLLEGRAVYKESVSFGKNTANHSWSQLEFNAKTMSGNFKVKEYNAAYYDLENALEKYPILELQDADMKANLIRSLQRGNIHPVLFIRDNKKEKVYIEACPKSKLIILHSQATRAAEISKNEGKNEPEINYPLPTPAGPASEPDQEEEEDLAPEVEPIGVPPTRPRKRTIK